MRAVMRAAPVDPAQARHDVRSILAGDRYHPKDSPRPLDSVLTWLDHHLHGVGHALGVVFLPIGRFFAWLWQHTFGALPIVLAVALGVAVLAAILFATVRAVERRPAARAAGHAAGAAGEPSATAEDLERGADEAEAAGRYGDAVRLRFRAGLLRLERDADAIVNRPGLTTREVRVRLHSERFDALADTFEVVAYGGVAAAADDADSARHDWRAVVGEARRG